MDSSSRGPDKAESHLVDKLSEYAKIAEAARILGISQNTLRAWADQGKVPVTRSPSGYRLFRPQDLEVLLSEIAKPLNRKPKAR